jgi:hypothetical protein
MIMKKLFIGTIAFIMIGCSTINEEHETSNSSCAKCKSNSVARIEYGLIDIEKISPELQEKLRKKEVILGGCLVYPQKYHCNDCGHKW